MTGIAFFAAAAQAVLQVCLLCVAGAFLEWSGHLGRVKRSGLAAVCFHVLLPLMNFGNTLAAGSGTAAGNYMGVICSFSLLLHLYGFVIGMALSRLVVRPGDEFSRMHIVLCSSFGNNNGIPLIVFPAVVLQGALLSLPGGGTMAQSVPYGIGVIALYNIPSAVIMWSCGPWLLRRGVAHLASSRKTLGDDDATLRPKIVPASLTRLLACAPKRVQLHILRVYEGLAAVVTPPVCGALAGLVLGAIPPLRALLLDQQSLTVIDTEDGTLGAMPSDGWASGSILLPQFNVSSVYIPAINLVHNVTGWFAATTDSPWDLQSVDAVASLLSTGRVSTNAAMVNVAPLGPSVFAAAATFGSAAPALMALIIGSSILDSTPLASSGGGEKLDARAPPSPSSSPGYAHKAPPLAERTPSSSSLTGGQEEGGDLPPPQQQRMRDATAAVGAPASPSSSSATAADTGDATRVAVVENGDDTVASAQTDEAASRIFAVSTCGDRCNRNLGGARWQAVLAVCVARLIIVPLCGLITVTILLRMGALPSNDSTLTFVLLLESAVPSAMNLQIICEQVQGNGRHLARVIAVSYAAAIFTMTAWIAIFLLMMKQILGDAPP